MHWFDTTLLALLGLGAGLGAWCGFVWQVARFLSLGLSVYGSIHFHDVASELLLAAVLQGADVRIVRAVAYLAVFLVIYLTLFYTIRIVRDGVRAAELETFDRLLGALLGAGKMGLLLGSLCLGLASHKNPASDAIMTKSVVAPVFADGMEAAVLLIPEEYKDYLRDQVQSMRDLGRTLQDQKARDRDERQTQQ